MAIEEILGFPHYHFDLEWWKTEANYARDMVQIIEEAAKMLRAHPEFKFVLDQATSIEPYLKAHPDKVDELKAWIAEGRVEVVGGTLAAPDHNIPTGEALVRQLVLGRAWAREKLDTTPVSGWAIDTFGHPSQIPQIYSKCGFETFTFARGVTPWYREHPLDYTWQAPDGSSIQTHWLAAHYNQFMALGRKGDKLIRGFFKEMKARLAYEQRRTRSKALMIPFGTDFCIPDPAWITFYHLWNKSEKPALKFEIPRIALRRVKETHDGPLPVVQGEANPLLTGGYESRFKLKRLCRESEHGILCAERLAALAWAAGHEYPEGELHQAWVNILKCDFHDTINGTGTDAVARDALARYALAGHGIEKVVETAAQQLTGKIEGNGDCFQVINPLPWPRTEMVRVKAAEIGDNVPLGDNGKPVPCQKVGDELVMALSLPALGFITLRLKPGKIKIEGKPFEDDENRILTPFYEIGKERGRWRWMLERESNRHVLHESRVGIFEPVVEEDVGNLWTVQLTGERERCGRGDAWHLVSSGAVALVYERHLNYPSARFTMRVWFYAATERIDVEAFVNFTGRDRRIRIAFPLGFTGGISMESPYGVERRVPGHWAAQTWGDVSDGELGVALLNRGNPGYTMSSSRIDVTLLRSLSILPLAGLGRFIRRNLGGIISALRRAARITRRGLFSMSEWEMYQYHGLLIREWSSEGPRKNKPGGGPLGWEHVGFYLKGHQEALCWERGEHTFMLGVLPHKGDFSSAELSRRGMEFNTPPIVRRINGMPENKEESLVSVEPGNVVLSVIKRAEDGKGLILRAVETAGKETEASIALPFKVRSVKKVLAVEEGDLGKAAVKGKKIRVNLVPFEIATLRVEL